MWLCYAPLSQAARDEQDQGRISTLLDKIGSVLTTSAYCSLDFDRDADDWYEKAKIIVPGDNSKCLSAASSPGFHLQPDSSAGQRSAINFDRPYSENVHSMHVVVGFMMCTQSSYLLDVHAGMTE